MLTHLHRNAEASSFGPGLFLLLVLVLWSGVHPEFSNSPTFSFYEVWGHRSSFAGFPNVTAFWHFYLQYATRKDVFLHWRLHGFDPGRIRTQDQTWAPPQGCPDGKPLLFVPQKPHKYTIPDTPFLVKCVCFFYFRQSWHWSQHLSSSVCHGIQQHCISACSCIHLVSCFFLLYIKAKFWYMSKCSQLQIKLHKILQYFN